MRRLEFRGLRYAAHYILLSPDKILKQHYIELDENDRIVKIAPLEEEMEETVFYNGILFPSTEEISIQTLIDLKIEGSLMSVADALFKSGIIASEHANNVFIYHLDGINLSSSEFRTSNGRSNCYIQRL